jgi:hypothetical protein
MLVIVWKSSILEENAFLKLKPPFLIYAFFFILKNFLLTTLFFNKNPR